MKKPAPNGRNDGHDMIYSQIEEGIYLGSDFCQGGVCLIHSEEFDKLGITYEINLSDDGNELPPPNLSGYLWLPVVDGYAPNKEQMEIGVEMIYQATEANEKIYVHCKNGHGRSPTLIAAFLKRHREMTVDQAIEHICNIRDEIHIEDAQKKALEKF